MGQPVRISTPMPTLQEIARRLGIAKATQGFLTGLVMSAFSKNGSGSTMSGNLHVVAKKAPAKKASTKKAAAKKSSLKKAAAKKAPAKKAAARKAPAKRAVV